MLKTDGWVLAHTNAHKLSLCSVLLVVVNQHLTTDLKQNQRQCQLFQMFTPDEWVFNTSASHQLLWLLNKISRVQLLKNSLLQTGVTLQHVVINLQHTWIISCRKILHHSKKCHEYTDSTFYSHHTSAHIMWQQGLPSKKVLAIA